MRDEVLPKSGNFVLNLDELEDPGTHWVAVFENEYYDSFGLPPPKCLENRILWYNTQQHQNVNSSLCGLYACYFIQMRNRGYSAYDVCYKKLKNDGNICTLIDQYVSKNVLRKV